MEKNHGTNCQCSEFKLGLNDDNINNLIELTELTCLNEKKKNSCRNIFPDEQQKYTTNDICCSFDNDPELIFILRFKEELNLRAINFITKKGMEPKEINLYLNEENVSFDIIEEEPNFHFEINHFTEKMENEVYPEVLKCSNLRTLVIHFRGDSKNVGLSYIGLKGFSKKGKRFIVNTKYEIMNKEKSKFGNDVGNIHFIDK